MNVSERVAGFSEDAEGRYAAAGRSEEWEHVKPRFDSAWRYVSPHGVNPEKTGQMVAFASFEQTKAAQHTA